AVDRNGRRLWALSIFVPVIAVALAGSLVHIEQQGSLRIATVQAGGRRGLEVSDQRPALVFANHVRTTNLVHDPVDAILWPEDVVQVDMPIESSGASSTIGEIAKVHNADVVAGVVEVSPKVFHNAAVVWSKDGYITQRYDKIA